jgi:hypothetical protein
MLSDAQIERWSRQIILPEVGGRGQLRLMAARVALLGDGPAATFASDLLARAGVPVERARCPDDADLLVDLAADEPSSTALARRAVERGVPLVRGRVGSGGGTVDTLVGQPCGLCLAAEAWPSGPIVEALAAPAAQALAALVAAEVLRVLLVGTPGGRRQRVDLGGGRFAGDLLDSPGCAACGARA